MIQILMAGLEVTNDPSQIDVLAGDGADGDFDGDSDVDLADRDRFAECFTGPDGGPVPPDCAAGDFDDDDDIDCDDWALFKIVWTAAGTPPALPECDASGVPPGGSAPAVTALFPASPNPMGPSARIAYSLAATGRVELQVFDVTGRLVRTLVDVVQGGGEHAAVWDGTDETGRDLVRQPIAGPRERGGPADLRCHGGHAWWPIGVLDSFFRSQHPLRTLKPV